MRPKPPGHDRRHILEIYGFATRLTIAVATPVVCTIAGGGRALLALFGSAAQPAFFALALLTFTRLIEAVAGQAAAIQSVISRYHHPLIGSAIGLTAALAVGALLLPQGGMDGMAIAVSTGIAISVLAPMAQLWIHDRLHPFAPPFLRTAGVSILGGCGDFGPVAGADAVPPSGADRRRRAAAGRGDMAVGTLRPGPRGQAGAGEDGGAVAAGVNGAA